VDRGFFQFSKQIRYKIRKGIERINSTSHEMTFEGRPLQELADRNFYVGTTCFSRVLSAEWEQSLIPEPIVLENYPYQDLDIILRHEVVAYIRSMEENAANGPGYLDGRLEILN
jgi:5'-nucleotidase/5'-nucleotidase/UDP-sugar diphosphatase